MEKYICTLISVETENKRRIDWNEMGEWLLK